jgi:hypothetical protein
MASPDQVRSYLACWFQLGKGVTIHRTGQVLSPRPLTLHNRYSDEFEACWQYLESLGGQDCYLEGTCQTIAELLSSQWDIERCPRCSLPIPLARQWVAETGCPCYDLPLWPNLDIPQPRAPLDVQQHLCLIHQRVIAASQRYAALNNTSRPSLTSPALTPSSCDRRDGDPPVDRDGDCPVSAEITIPAA